jgi:hypothetical protein
MVLVSSVGVVKYIKKKIDTEQLDFTTVQYVIDTSLLVVVYVVGSLQYPAVR